ncbi:hypothetical protein FRC20_001006 [Serendipita sp. 405]|nr:hypothetical protein FRC15_000543 [Serendipita sp. 397]KAG8876668.1 hypothetical protein FRC20_001006 [Serendipita sp. 405]
MSMRASPTLHMGPSTWTTGMPALGFGTANHRPNGEGATVQGSCQSTPRQEKKQEYEQEQDQEQEQEQALHHSAIATATADPFVNGSAPFDFSTGHNISDNEWWDRFWAQLGAEDAELSPTVGSPPSSSSSSPTLRPDPIPTSTTPRIVEATVQEDIKPRLNRLDRFNRSLIEKHSGTRSVEVLEFVERYMDQNEGKAPIYVTPKKLDPMTTTTTTQQKQMIWKTKPRANAAPESATCALCGRTFPTVQKASSHLLSNHIDKITGDRRGLFKCADCKALYMRSNELRRHRVRSHGAQATRRCARCTKKSLDRPSTDSTITGDTSPTTTSPPSSQDSTGATATATTRHPPPALALPVCESDRGLVVAAAPVDSYAVAPPSPISLTFIARRAAGGSETIPPSTQATAPASRAYYRHRADGGSSAAAATATATAAATASQSTYTNRCRTTPCMGSSFLSAFGFL